MEQTTERERFQSTINMIDKFYLAVNEAINPMIALLDFNVEGEMSFEVFLNSCLATFKRLPVLKSVIRGKEGWFQRLWWEEVDTDGSELVEYLDYYEDGRLSPEDTAALHAEAYQKYSNTKWDVRDEPPIKIKLVRKGEASWSMFYMIHHAVTDAHGANGFLQLLAENYMLLDLGQSPRQDPLEQVRNIHKRLILKTSPWQLLKTLLFYLRYERLNRPRAMTPLLTEWKQREGIVRALDLVVNESLARKVLERIRDLGLSFNEAMILACARNVYQWIRSQGRQAQKISIAVPVNMRSYLNLDASKSVSNCSVTMNINLRASLFAKTDQLIESISFQNQGMKRLRLPLIGILQTALFCWLPLRLLKGLMARSIASGTADRHTPTIVFSNVGAISSDQEGNPVLVPVGTKGVVTSVRYSNPIAYPVAASILAITYGGSIQVSLSYLDPVLDRKSMEEFLTGFEKELFSILDEKALMKTPLPPFRESYGNLDPPRISASPGTRD